MGTSWEAATKAQYDDDTNLAARQALFDWMTAATPLPEPLSDMSVLSGTRVLDLGCGNGRFLANATQAGAVTVGSDLSFGMAEAARTTSSAPVLCSDAHAVPFADHSIDTILALWMLYHVDDKHTALTECRRVLTTDGQLVSSTNSGASGRLDEIVCTALGDQLDHAPDHWHAPLDFTSENGADIVASVFDTVEIHEFGNTFEVGDADVLVRYVGSMLGPITAEHGDLDTVALLYRVGEQAAAEIASNGTVTIERFGTVFIGR